tara:strand:- start:1178 stop:2320 length:1143 start_codon:yes stop_codon:yes gene_type:complete
MNDLLKEAIADAKAVRTTALANAKMALEEAFTPKLQSMISAKIREEAEYDELEEDEMEDNMDIPMDEMEDEMEEGGMREDEDEHGMDEMREDELGMDEMEDEMEEDMEGTDEMREDEHEEMTEMDDEMETEGHHEMEESEDDLELESIIKELEDEIEEDEHDELEESNDATSGIGGSDNKQPAPAANADSTDDPEGTGAKVVAESEDGMEGESETLDTLHEEDEDEIDLEEVIKSLREEEEELEESEDGMEGESEVINNLTEKLKESYSVVKFLRSKINEVNLLNAKLLFTNKLFRNGNLNESQKMKVIETFDRAKSTREVKLVYTTLAESTMATRTTRKRTAIKEGFASKAGGSTKPRRVISEGADMASRFKKLAGLTK